MKKQILIVGIIVLLIAVGLSGCNQTSNSLTSDKDKFVGTWNVKVNDKEGTFVFYSNGTLITSSGSRATWEIKDGLLVITGGSGTTPSTLSYKFSNGNKTVVLINSASGTTAILTKQ
jgi:ABC-type Fe3+-hydroxamate transport system substrate-binding protein